MSLRRNDLQYVGLALMLRVALANVVCQRKTNLVRCQR
jgi:hypothetical protein